MVFPGLVSRADLVDNGGTVLFFDEASSRLAIKVNDIGESVKMLARNLMTSS